MSDAVLVALIPSAASIIVALIVMLQVRGVHEKVQEIKVSVDGELHALKEAISAANLAEGRILGAAEARAEDNAARLDRASAAALVLKPVAPKED